MAYEHKVSIPPELADQTFYLFARAAGRVLTATDRFLAQFNITNQHLTILLMLEQHDGSRQIRIGKAIGIQKARMVDLLDSLEFKGYVKREQNAQDRREHRLRLTDLGQKIIAEIRRLFQEKKPPYLRELSVAEIHYLNTMLSRVIGFKVGAIPRKVRIEAADIQYADQAEEPGLRERG